MARRGRGVDVGLGLAAALAMAAAAAAAPSPAAAPRDLTDAIRCDGKTDDTRAIQAAIDAAASGAGRLTLPAGTCIVSATLLVSRQGVYIAGAGEGRTIVSSTRGDADVFKFHAPAKPEAGGAGWSAGGGTGFFFGGLSDLSITTTARSVTGGAAVEINNVSEIQTQRLWISGTYDGVVIIASGITRHIDDDVANPAHDAFRVVGTPGVFFTRCTGGQFSGGHGNATFHITEGAGVHIADSGSSTANYALLVDPGRGQAVLDVFLTNDDFDNSHIAGAKFTTAGGGSIYAVQAVGGRVGWGEGPGLAIDGGSNLNFVNFQAVKNTRQGILITGGDHIAFVDVQALGNASLGGDWSNIEIDGGDGLSFIGGVSGRWLNEGVNAPYGLIVGGAFTGSLTVHGLDLRHNRLGAVSHPGARGQVSIVDSLGVGAAAGAP